MKCNKYKCRIGNVKLGKFTASLEDQQKADYNEDEWENLSDVESALDNIGIKLRENFNTYKDTEVILQEIGEKWETLDQVSKNSLVSALFGTRQRELGITLFENWDQVGKYAEISENSYGTALEKMESYTDSVGAAQKRMTNAIEKIALDLDGASIMKFFYNTITEVIENFRLLSIALVAFIGIVKSGSIIDGVFSKIGNIGQSLTNAALTIDKIKDGVKDGGSVASSAWARAQEGVQEGYLESVTKHYAGRLSEATEGLDERTKAEYQALQAELLSAKATDREIILKQLKGEADENYLQATLEYISEQDGGMSLLKTIRATHGDELRAIKEEIISREGVTDAQAEYMAALRIASEELKNNPNGAVGQVVRNVEDAEEKGHLKKNAAGKGVMQGISALLLSGITAYGGSQLGGMFGDTGSILGGILGGAVGEEGGRLIFTKLVDSISKVKGQGSKAVMGAITSGLKAAIKTPVGLAAIGISIAGIIYSGIKKHHEEQVKILQEDFKEAADTFQQMQNASVNAKTYDELAKGVDNFGNNISLSEEEYQKFLEISNALAEVFPELVTHTDSAGNAFLGLNGKVGDVTDEIERLKNEAQETADSALFKETGALWWKTSVFEENYKESAEDYRTAYVGKSASQRRIKALNTIDENGSIKGLDVDTYNKLTQAGVKFDSSEYLSEDGYTYKYNVVVNKDSMDEFNAVLGEEQKKIAGFEKDMAKSSSAVSEEVDALFRELVRGNLDETLNFDSSSLQGLDENMQEIVRSFLNGLYMSADPDQFKQLAADTVQKLSDALAADDGKMVKMYYKMQDATNPQEYLKLRDDFKESLLAAFRGDNNVIDAQEMKILIGFGFKYDENSGESGKLDGANWKDSEDYYSEIKGVLGENWGVSQEDFYNTFDVNEAKEIFELVNSGALTATASLDVMQRVLKSLAEPETLEGWSNKFSQIIDNIVDITDEGGEEIKEVFSGALTDGEIIDSDELTEKFPDLSPTAREKLEALQEEVADGGKSVEEAYLEFLQYMVDEGANASEQIFTLSNAQLFGADSGIDGMINTYDELSIALNKVADSYDLVQAAREEQNEFDQIGLKTAMELLSANAAYAEVLQFTSEGISLKGNAEDIVAKIQLESVKAQIKSMIAEQQAAKAAAEATLKKIHEGATEVQITDTIVTAAISEIKSREAATNAIIQQTAAVVALNKAEKGSVDVDAFVETQGARKVFFDTSGLGTTVKGADLEALKLQLYEDLGYVEKYVPSSNGNAWFQEKESIYDTQINALQGIFDSLDTIKPGDNTTWKDWKKIWDPASYKKAMEGRNKGKSGKDFKEEVMSILDALKNARKLIDKEWEAMLSFDEKTKKDSGTKYFEKMKDNLLETVKATRAEMALLTKTYESTGKDLKGEQMTQKDYMDQINTYTSELIELQKDLNNLDDEEIEDKQKLLETQGASLETLIKIQKEYLETADTLEEYIEREEELKDLEMKRYEILKKINDFRKNQYDHELKYFDGEAISNPQYEVAFKLYQKQIEKQIDTVLENRNKLWKEKYDKLINVDGMSPAQAYNEATVDEEVMDLTEEYWSLIEQRGDAIVKRINDRIAELDREIDIHEREKPEEWSNFGQIGEYGKESLELLEKKAMEIRKALEDTSLLTDEQINEFVDELNSVTEAMKDAQEQMLQDEVDYQDKQFNALINRIESFKDDLEEEKDKVNDYYDDLIGNLKDEADARDENNRQMELELALRNSLEQKQRVYRQGIGWVYETPKKKVKDAKKDLQDFKDDQKLEDLEKTKDKEIELLDKRIEAWDLYIQALQYQHDRVERENEEFLLEEMMGLNSQEAVNNAIINDWNKFNENCEGSFKYYDGIFDTFLDNYESKLEQLQELQKQQSEIIDAGDFMHSNNKLPEIENDKLAGGSASGDMFEIADAYGMSETDKRALKAAGEMHAYAMKAGNKELAKKAHDWAEGIRRRYGYSGGDDGSQNIYIDDTYRPDKSREDSVYIDWQAEYLKMSEADKEAILKAREKHALAVKNNDPVGKALAHYEAEAIRNKYGYSGGSWGDEFLMLTDNRGYKKNLQETSKLEDSRLSDLKKYLNEYQSSVKKSNSAGKEMVNGEKNNLSGHEGNYWYQKGINADMIDDWWQYDQDAQDLWYNYIGSFDDFLNDYADRIQEYADLAEQMGNIQGSTLPEGGTGGSGSTGGGSTGGGSSGGGPTGGGNRPPRPPQTGASAEEIYNYVGMQRNDRNIIAAMGQVASENAGKNPAVVKQAHEEAEKIRAKYGYSGGPQGDQFIPLKPGDKYYDLIQYPLPSYAKGIESGAVTYTGLAMLHGTPQAPEYVLNTPQIENLLYNLTTAKAKAFERVEHSGGDTIYQLNGDIVIDGASDPKQFWNEVARSMNNRSNVTKNR